MVVEHTCIIEWTHAHTVLSTPGAWPHRFVCHILCPPTQCYKYSYCTAKHTQRRTHTPAPLTHTKAAFMFLILFNTGDAAGK